MAVWKLHGHVFLKNLTGKLNTVRPGQKTGMKFNSNFFMDLLLPLGSQLTWLRKIFYNLRKDKMEHLDPIYLLCATVKITLKNYKCIASQESTVKYSIPWLSLTKQNFWCCDLKGEYDLKEQL